MALCNQPILILGPRENSKPGRWSGGRRCPRCWLVPLDSRPLPTGPLAVPPSLTVVSPGHNPAITQLCGCYLHSHLPPHRCAHVDSRFHYNELQGICKLLFPIGRRVHWHLTAFHGTRGKRLKGRRSGAAVLCSWLWATWGVQVRGSPGLAPTPVDLTTQWDRQTSYYYMNGRVITPVVRATKRKHAV